MELSFDKFAEWAYKHPFIIILAIFAFALIGATIGNTTNSNGKAGYIDQPDCSIVILNPGESEQEVHVKALTEACAEQLQISCGKIIKY